MMVADTPNKPNLLLWLLILLSIGIHAAIFGWLAGIGRPDPPVYIELDLRSRETPVQREIPRPTPAPQPGIPTVPDIPETVNLPLTRSPFVSKETLISGALPAEMQPLEIPAVDRLKIAVWEGKSEKIVPEETAAAAGDAASEYLQRMKKIIPRIAAEADRRYKKKARKRQIQGRTAIRVVIDASGEIVDVSIAESSSYDILDAIALKAVASASPFPKPPDGPVTLDIPIHFKLE